MRNNLYKKSACLEVRNDFLSCRVSVKSLVYTAVFIYFCVVIQYKDFFKTVTLADLKVVGVMAGGYFDASGAEFHVYIIVGNNGNFSAY